MDLPSSWASVELAEIAETSSGGTPSRQNSQNYDGTIPWIKSGNLKDGPIRDADESISELALKSSAAKLFPVGTLLIALYGATIGKLGILSIAAATNQAVCGIFLTDHVSTPFLFSFLVSHRRKLIELGQGGAQPNISQQIVRSIEIPLPPFNEQKRIVSKIEELFSELDAGEDSLRRALRQLGVYRQSLLKQAFEGKLTAPWRRRDPHLLESPDQLLNRIQAERKSRYEQQLKEWKVALKEWEINDEKRPPKPAILKPVSGNIDIFESPFPAEWNSLNLSQIALELGQGWSPKCLGRAADSAEWGVMKTTAVQPGRFQSEASKVLPPNFAPRPWLGLRHNDILITRAGPRSRCGVVCRVVGDHPKLLLCDKAYRLAFAQEVTSSEFIELLLCSPVASDAIEKLKTGINDSGVNITQTIFLQLVVPVPSLPEQREIVRLLDEQFTVIEQNEREIHAALKRSAALRQSILKKAFTGQLVPQDPTDEPASALLERIREERDASASAPKKKTASKRVTRLKS